MASPGFDEHRETVLMDGRPRAYTLLTPLRHADSAPLVLLFHGSNQTAARFRTASGNQFDAFAEHGAVVAYLHAHERAWNDARVWIDFSARAEGFDDVGFARAVIDATVAQHGVDPGRVHAVGYSNGGQLVIRLLHQVPEQIAGAAVISATQPAPQNFLPTLQPLPVGRTVDDPDAPPPGPHAVPTVFIHGTKDAIVPYGGGFVALRDARARGELLSAPATGAYYAARNGIHRAPRSDEVAHGVERTLWTEPGHPPVALYTIAGGGHALQRHAIDGFLPARVIGDAFGLAVA